MKRYFNIANNLFREYLNNRRLLSEKSNQQIQFYNFWPHDENEEEKMTNFIRSLCHLDQYPNGKLAFFSVYGSKKIVKMSDAHVKVFYTPEDVKRRSFIQWADHGLGIKGKNSIDLALGMELFESEKYMRFPFWLLRPITFRPKFIKEDIIKCCNELRWPDLSMKTKFASLVAGMAWDGLREQMVCELGNISFVNCAGKVLHNDDSLISNFNNNKVEYLKQFQFNICPENHNVAGYVTEKCFEAHLAGCIPIYWGAMGEPEKDVLNKDAIIFWDRKTNGKDAINKVKELYEHPNLWKEFASQPRLLNTAEEYIFDSLYTLENRLAKLFAEKMPK